VGWFSQFAHLLPGSGNHDSVSREDDGPLGVVDQLQRLFVVLRLGRETRTIAWQLRHSPFPIQLACRLLGVCHTPEL